MVVNYDIHWNPVRVIQRMGRIDRLGSPNKIIFGINYWPSDNINTYLNLKGRIEGKMAMMKLAGSEVNLEFTESFKEMASDANFEDRMNEKMIRQMQTSWEDIEDNQSNLGFDNLSLESYRQDLLSEYKIKNNFYENMPKGIYTGFKVDKTICKQTGIIALLGYPAKPSKTLNYQYQTYDLIYIDMDGNTIQQLFGMKEIFLEEQHGVLGYQLLHLLSLRL
jgi:superfamily II DNA/RNA helicase